MIKFPASILAKISANSLLHPRTKLGRVTKWLGLLSLLLLVLYWITGSSSHSALRGWAIFIGSLFLFCGMILTFRWAWYHLIWRLRNRLIVTYVLIGVIPIVLLLLLAGLGAYLSAGQFADYVVISDLQAESKHLGSANDALATQLGSLQRTGSLNEQTAGKLAAAFDESFPQRTVTVWQGNKGFTVTASGAPLSDQPDPIPAYIKANFNDIVIDHDALQLRALSRYGEGPRQLTVISSIPVTPEFLQRATSRLGSVTLIPPPTEGGVQIPPPKNFHPAKRWRVDAGRVPPASNRYDHTFRFYTLLNMVEWKTGKTFNGAIGVVTRPSLVYTTLFATLGDDVKVLRYALLGIAIFLGIIELVALYIGIRLSQSITHSVAELYMATEHVNLGNLTYRIGVRSTDQMAALERSFNSMTESLVKLVAEQKEKQRLESDLASARLVQRSLLPQEMPQIPGYTLATRSVACYAVGGDYLDIVPTASGITTIVVADVAGKGLAPALIGSSFRSAFRAMVNSGVPLEQIANQINVLHYDEGEQSRRLYVTAIFLQLDPRTNSIQVVNAGHNPAFLVFADDPTGDSVRVQRIKASGIPVGMMPDSTYHAERYSLPAGARLLLYTDGLTEVFRGEEEFGEARLLQTFLDCKSPASEDVIDSLWAALAAFGDEKEQSDDMTAVVLLRHSNP